MRGAVDNFPVREREKRALRNEGKKKKMLLHVLILEIEQEGKLSLEQESITISRGISTLATLDFIFRAHTADFKFSFFFFCAYLNEN